MLWRNSQYFLFATSNFYVILKNYGWFPSSVYNCLLVPKDQVNKCLMFFHKKSNFFKSDSNQQGNEGKNYFEVLKEHMFGSCGFQQFGLLYNMCMIWFELIVQNEISSCYSLLSLTLQFIYSEPAVEQRNYFSIKKEFQTRLDFSFFNSSISHMISLVCPNYQTWAE